ncbi:MAG: N-acetylmuramoyl-L-alanine amidase [Bacteroidales bacterium]|nr:N-acetylmuramoyl-L-alanine amidase [Bacteroidales bacterium]
MKRLLFVFVVFLSLLSSSAFSQSNNQEFRVSFSKLLKASSAEFVFQPPDGFSFIGISAYCMDNTQDVTVHYRLKRMGSWTPWIAFWLFTDGDTPDRVSFEAPPVTGEFSAIQFKASKSINEEIVFRLFIPDPKIKNSANCLEAISDNPGECSCLIPDVCRKECWCSSDACSEPYEATLTESTHIIIHHSAGHNSSDDYAAVVAYYWDLHVNTNGWDDIGYNWLIDPNGVIYEGRGDGVQGAHFSCMNWETTGICMIGNYVYATPGEASLQSLRNLLAWEVCSKDLDPLGSKFHSSSELDLFIISGHLDGNNSQSDHSCAKGTVCPGDQLYKLLPEIRTDVASLACMNIDSTAFESDYISINQFLVFPNPCRGEFSISLIFKENAGHYCIEILDAIGRIIYEKRGTAYKEDMLFPFDRRDLLPGQYLVKVTTDQEIVVKAIILNR